jgi:hypothetical protein
MSTLNARSGTKFLTTGQATTLGNVQSLDVSKLTSPGRTAEVYVHVESHQLVDKPSDLTGPESNDERDWDRKDMVDDSQV